MKGSFIIIGFFISGLVCGYFGVIPADVAQNHDISFCALCALLICLGITVGNDPTAWQRFKA